jgi:hypothetical protein
MRHANRTDGEVRKLILEKKHLDKKRGLWGIKGAQGAAKKEATNEAIRLPPGLKNDGERLHTACQALCKYFKLACTTSKASSISPIKFRFFRVASWSFSTVTRASDSISSACQ